MNTQKVPETLNNSPTYLKARALASKLGVSPKTVFRWADDRKLTRYKINERVVLFDLSEAVALVQSSRIS